ncbi:hemerythrin domain-containing protein [Myxococcota bacterium]|nr:hemerythrin domain-containing protein [Myxococcota bacterium]
MRAPLPSPARSPFLPSAAVATDPVAWLLDCHGRIRKVVGGVRALAGAAADDPRAAQTAQDCARYLRIGLPLHALDEDASLRPLLLRGPGAGAVERALDRMSSEHERIEAGLPQALDTLEAAAAGVLVAGPLVAGPLAELAGWLEGLLLEHIAHEEQHILPAASQLSPADLALLARQMRARRSPSPVGAES